MLFNIIITLLFCQIIQKFNIIKLKIYVTFYYFLQQIIPNKKQYEKASKIRHFSGFFIFNILIFFLYYQILNNLQFFHFLKYLPFLVIQINTTKEFWFNMPHLYNSRKFKYTFFLLVIFIHQNFDSSISK